MDERLNRLAGPRAGRHTFWLAVLTLGAAIGPVGATPQEETPLEARSFSIPETRQAAALHDRALEHLDAERWPEAIADLQELIEDHRGNVLGGSNDPAGDERSRSQQPVHRGAADTARRALLALPAPARAYYGERFAADANAALARARRSADRRALIEVARRWPISDAARLAWWTVGDLELELGNAAAAGDAWTRANELTELAGLEPSPGAKARLDYVGGAVRDDSVGLEALEPAALAREATVPGPDGHSWRQSVDVGSRRVPFGVDSPETYNLYPARSGDTLLVSNSLRVFAFDAWTGKERWRSNEAPGWERVDAHQMHALRDGEKIDRQDLYDAIDRRSVLIAPAASSGIVVAPLQIPMTQLGNTRYQNIPITRAIPDRRLFAFDLETGRELWNHTPPPLWDGESGAFQERMRVAAPPVIAGTRVLVPVYRMQGRIDYHLACYDLFSGSLLWSTALISGQLPLNMFGRHSHEFASAPVHVEGDRVVALTQLGSVAACDLYTGQVLWETLYEQIPLPPTVHWAPRERRLHWRNAAPMITDGVVVATPLDSRDMIGLDLELGSLLWSVAYDRVQRRGEYMRLALLGAADDTVYLGGRSIMACRAPAGLRSRSGPIEVGYSPDLPVDHHEFLPRPAVGDRHIVAPTTLRRVVVNKPTVKDEDLTRSADFTAEQSSGNALLGDGALFLLSNRHLTAIFDWNVLERRAAERFDADPTNDLVAMAYAELLAGRGRSEIEESRLSNAADHLARSREILTGRLADLDRGFHSDLEGLLHRVLRDEAEALRRSVRPWSVVLELLRQAEAVAPNEESLRDTLVTMADLLDGAGARTEWLAVLDRLERDCGTLLLSTSEEGPSLPVTQWVAFERARDHARTGAVGSELDVLHSILAAHGDVSLFGYEAWYAAGNAVTPAGAGTPLPRVTRRIADLIETHGRAPYAPFEARAQGELERARSSGDSTALERVIDRYPHSDAAVVAADARIAAALAKGQTKKVISLVQRSIPDQWSVRHSAERELQLLLHMGLALERDGNGELYEAMIAELAAEHPQLSPRPAADPSEGSETATSPFADGSTLEQLAQAIEPASEPVPSDFDQAARVTAEVSGSYDPVGIAPAVEGAARARAALLLSVRDSEHSDIVTAFSEADPSRPVWVRDVEGGVLGDRDRATYLARNTLTVAGTEAVLGIDLDDGSVRWKWNADQLGVAGVTGANGISIGVFGSTRRGGELRAFDAAKGFLLWTRRLPAGEHWPVPVCGGGRVVLLPRNQTSTALALDLWTGSEVVRFDPGSVHDGDLRGAWIEGDTLILPHFPKTSSSTGVISAWDLTSGLRRWAVENTERLDFDSIARTKDHVYLIFSAGRQRPGAIQQLDTRVGAVRTLNALVRPGDVPIGMDRHTVTRLSDHWLFLQSRSDTSASETIVRAIHLPFGEKWQHRLPVAPGEIYDGLPLPVSSSRTTVLAWTEPARDISVRPMTQLLFLDRELGTLQDSRSLAPDLGDAGHISFALLGRSLAILGNHETVFLSR